MEEGSELNIISGCASDPTVENGVHIGISEFFIGKNAKMTFTMIHSWGEKVAVRPRTVAIVDEGGLYMSNYVCLDKVADVQMYPTCRLIGKGATARLNSILVAPEGAHLDIGGKAILEVSGTKAEIITRSISTGGTIINRGLLQGLAEGVRAHLECNGLMLNDKGRIYAIPELDAQTGNSELSHGHLDHAGGAARLAQLVPIDNVLLPREKPCKEVEALLHNLGSKTNKENMFPGEKISLGNCIIDVVDAPQQIEETGNGNENSAIIKISCGKNSVLFTGDATGEAELRAVNSNIKAQVLKISHHGSPSSSELEFLQAVSPSTAVISVGSNNTFGHPSGEVLGKLSRLNISTYRTDKLGAVKVVFDGSQHECYSYRYQKEYF